MGVECKRNSNVYCKRHHADNVSEILSDTEKFSSAVIQQLRVHSYRVCQDVDAFALFGLTHPSVEAIGETRYDQVWQRSDDAKKKHLIPPAVLKGKNCFLPAAHGRKMMRFLFLQLKKFFSMIQMYLQFWYRTNRQKMHWKRLNINLVQNHARSVSQILTTMPANVSS